MKGFYEFYIKNYQQKLSTQVHGELEHVPGFKKSLHIEISVFYIDAWIWYSLCQNRQAVVKR